jgi:hypothetical protein
MKHIQVILKPKSTLLIHYQSFFRYGADILRNVLKKIEKYQNEFKQIIALVDFTSSVFEICLKKTIVEA